MSPTGGGGRRDRRDRPIVFGTSGWRGVLGREVTYERLDAVVAAAAEWLALQGRSDRVLVGYDTRFASAALARVASDRLRAHGLRPQLSADACPTPAVAYTIMRRRAAGALVLTASHNPPEYHGLKVFGPHGGGIDDVVARELERDAAGWLARGPKTDPAPGAARRVDWMPSYRDAVLGVLDRAAIRRSRLRVVFDAMHGTGAGGIDTIMSRAGARVERMRETRDPLFGGASPDPSSSSLGALRKRMRAGRGLRIGLANDGDADRLAAVDERGHLLSETQVVALLVDHLASTGRLRRGVAISQATGTLVERVAEAHGLPVTRHPMGFKHLSRALEAGEADAAGEESGGFAWRPLARDKDGILAGCLLAEGVALRGALADQLAVLERRFGRRACGRSAVPASPGLMVALGRLQHQPPSRVGGCAVRDVARVDPEAGLRMSLDDGFLMLRASGTEPVVRIYAEASGPRALAQRLEAGLRVLRRARGAS